MRIFATPKEAAKILNCTPRTILNWIEAGALEVAPRVGRKYAIYVKSIAALAQVPVEEIQALLQQMDVEEEEKARERRKTRIINKPGALIAA